MSMVGATSLPLVEPVLPLAPTLAPALDPESREWLRSLRDEGGDLEDIANQAADDALMGVLRRLDDFRGASRFTTWAYKFALYEAAVKLRKRAWQGREVPLEPESWGLYSSAGLEPDAEAEQSELVGTLQSAIAEALTPHQRRVLVALALNGVPIDVLAERLNTNRGALYKTLHDARRKLRQHLEERGLALDNRLKEKR
jgi:RNA polymerase sigma-70 factor (ECF subfamily)